MSTPTKSCTAREFHLDGCHVAIEPGSPYDGPGPMRGAPLFWRITITTPSGTRTGESLKGPDDAEAWALMRLATRRFHESGRQSTFTVDGFPKAIVQTAQRAGLLNNGPYVIQ